jgi:hypothetical protein
MLLVWGVIHHVARRGHGELRETAHIELRETAHIVYCLHLGQKVRCLQLDFRVPPNP